ncbi:unnamed protein product [Rotaria sp. Silwood1]|nr:unnamed protein product [Rotaria sp. Silwood1]
MIMNEFMFDNTFQTVNDLWNDAMKSVTYTSYDDLKAKYDKYSIERYFLEHENMSRGAIDFISLMYNVDMQTSLIEMVRSTVILTLNPEYSQIDGGFYLLTDAFERNCKNVPDGRCKIYTNTRVKGVHYIENPNNSSIRPWVRLVIGENSTTIRFDSVIVSTTARAASLIEFEPRSLFIDKYRALRQLHYDCATKIAHSFSRPFWRAENIQGGYSITDLPIRFVFYNNFNTTANSVNDGAFILTSYVWATDALLWSALSKDQTCEKSLQDLIQLHNRSDIRSLVVSCEVKNWCTDQYAHGAYALFTPNQETNLHDELGTSIKNIVHFTGEHISYVHRWIEGAIQSSMRVLMFYQEEDFDVAIIDGGALGLATALNLAKKAKDKRIVILQREDDVKPLELAPFHLVNERYYLSKLGQLVLPMWRELEKEANMSPNSLLNTLNGFLYIGQSVSDMIEFCRNLSVANCTQWSSTQMSSGQSFITVNQPGLHLSQSGFINVTLLNTVLRILVTKTPNILIRDKETFLSVQQISDQSRMHITTDRGSLTADKIIFLPGAFTKTMMNTLGLNLSINLYELPSAVHFRRLQSSSNLTVSTWSFVSANGDYYAGFPQDQSNYLRVEPRINPTTMLTINSPLNRTNKPDQQIIDRMLTWVGQHLSQTIDLTNPIMPTDTTLDSMLSDRGFILDYVPGFEQKLVLGTDSWSSIQYIPAFAEILARLILTNGSSTWSDDYGSIIQDFSVNINGRIIQPEPTPQPNGVANTKNNTALIFSVLLSIYFLLSVDV